MRFKHPFRKLAKTHLWISVENKNGLICERCGATAIPVLVKENEMQYHINYPGHFDTNKEITNIAVFYTCGELLAKEILE